MYIDILFLDGGGEGGGGVPFGILPVGTNQLSSQETK